jgi:hypothetical protein
MTLTEALATNAPLREAMEPWWGGENRAHQWPESRRARLDVVCGYQDRGKNRGNLGAGTPASSQTSANTPNSSARVASIQ